MQDGKRQTGAKSDVRANVLGVVVFTVVLAAVVVVLYPVFAPARIGHERSMVSNIRALSISLLIYASDHDDKLPLAVNWYDAVWPYAKDDRWFTDFEIQNRGEDEFGIAFYEPISGVEVKRVIDPEEVPLAFQSTLLYRSASSDLSTLPNPPRNGKTNAVVFLDSHAESVEPDWPKTPIVLKIRPKSSEE